MQRCLIGSLPVMKCGVFNMTRKQNDGARGGKRRINGVIWKCWLGYGNLFGRPRLWPDKWIPHHDSDPAHEVLRVCEFLAMNPITKMDHPPYSPDLVHCDFWLFPKLKNGLKGQRFADLSDIQCNVKTLLWGIPENYFQDCFRQWHHSLTKCIASQGEYFEGDSSHQCTDKQILLSQGHSGN